MLRFQVKFDLTKLPASSDPLEDCLETFMETYRLCPIEVVDGTDDTAVFGAYTKDDKPSYDLMRSCSQGEGLPEYTREEYAEEFPDDEYLTDSDLDDILSNLRAASHVVSVSQLSSIGGGLASLLPSQVNVDDNA